MEISFFLHAIANNDAMRVPIKFTVCLCSLEHVNVAIFVSRLQNEEEEEREAEDWGFELSTVQFEVRSKRMLKIENHQIGV
jgi:hypothetical protein